MPSYCENRTISQDYPNPLELHPLKRQSSEQSNGMPCGMDFNNIYSCVLTQMLLQSVFGIQHRAFHIPPHRKTSIMNEFQVEDECKLIGLLLIDEYSTVSTTLFEKVHQMCTVAKHNQNTMGGINTVLFGNRNQHSTIHQPPLFKPITPPSIGRQLFLQFEAYTLEHTWRFENCSKMKRLVNLLYKDTRSNNELEELCTMLNERYDETQHIEPPFTIVTLRQNVRKALNKPSIFIHAQEQQIVHWKPEIQFDHIQLTSEQKQNLYQITLNLPSSKLGNIDTDGLFFTQIQYTLRETSRNQGLGYLNNNTGKGMAITIHPHDVSKLQSTEKLITLDHLPLAVHIKPDGANFNIQTDTTTPTDTIPVLPTTSAHTLMNVNLIGKNGELIRNVRFKIRGFKLAPGYIQTDWWLQGATIPKKQIVLIDIPWPPNGQFSWESFLVCFTRNQAYKDIRLLRPL